MSEAMTKELAYRASDGFDVKLTHDIIRSALCQGDTVCSAKEIFLFAKLCQARKLNPFIGDAYLVKYGSRAASIIPSKAYWMRKLKAAKGYSSHQAGILLASTVEGKVVVDKHIGTFYMPQTQTLVGGWAEVVIGDVAHYHDVQLSVFDKGRATWKEMPATMIRKVALAQLIREILPDDFNGMYTEEEAMAMKNVTENNEQDDVRALRDLIGKVDNGKYKEKAQGLKTVVALKQFYKGILEGKNDGK